MCMNLISCHLPTPLAPNLVLSMVFPQISFHRDLICVVFLMLIFWFSLLLPLGWSRHPRIGPLLILGGFLILGIVFTISLESTTWFSVYIGILCYFHFSEFLLVSRSSGKFSFDSLLINHGVHYALAFTLSAGEHFLFPYSFSPFIQNCGLILVIMGLTIRAAAVLTAGSAFTHLIAHRKATTHSLVTGGIYSLMRHPGYCGWLMWVTSSQILAGNVLSSLAFFGVSWYFFRERIEYEEKLLVDFFGAEYLAYKRRVPFSGVPLIR